MGKATIFISGTVSQMPRYRDVQTKNGKRTIMSFNVPADHGWGDNKETTFFECEHWLPETERGVNYITHAMGKGAKVAVVGDAYLHPWTGKDGTEHWSARVDVRDLDILKAAPEVDVKDEAPRPQPRTTDLYDDSIPF